MLPNVYMVWQPAVFIFQNKELVFNSNSYFSVEKNVSISSLLQQIGVYWALLGAWQCSCTRDSVHAWFFCASPSHALGHHVTSSLFHTPSSVPRWPHLCAWHWSHRTSLLETSLFCAPSCPAALLSPWLHLCGLLSFFCCPCTLRRCFLLGPVHVSSGFGRVREYLLNERMDLCWRFLKRCGYNWTVVNWRNCSITQSRVFTTRLPSLFLLNHPATYLQWKNGSSLFSFWVYAIQVAFCKFSVYNR